MLAVAALGGIVSLITALGVYELVDFNYDIEIRSAFGAIVIVGPVEEFAKLIGLFMSYFIFRRELDEPLDGLIYMSCVVLGFSIVENYFYAISEPELSALIIFRLLIATPGHLLFSAPMGLAFYFYKKKGTHPKFLLVAYLYGSATHGSWDAILFEPVLTSFAYPLILALASFTYKNLVLILNYSAAKSPFRKSLRDFIETYQEPEMENGVKCLSCGNVEPRQTYQFGKIRVQRCAGCAGYVSSSDSMFYIFHHFGSRFQNLTKHYFLAPSKHKEFDVLFSSNFVSREHKAASFDLEELNSVLEKLNNDAILELETKWWFQSYAGPDRSHFLRN